MLDIKNDDSVYTVESDFSDTCYDIIRNSSVVDSVCTNEELLYQSTDLAYGEYTIIQKSNGLGYRKDTEVYNVVISSSNQKPIVTLNNYLIRNTININKKACKDSSCVPEKDAIFSVMDKNGNQVNELATDENGNTNILLGYGSYTIKQLRGIEGYGLADDINEKIIDEESEYNNAVFNYYIKKKEEPIKEKVKKIEEKKEEVEEAVPDTKADGDLLIQFIDTFVQFFTSILDKIVG